MGKRERVHVAACGTTLLILSGAAFLLWIDLDGPGTWAAGGLALMALLGLWAHLFWVREQLAEVPEADLPVLQGRLLRRLWGGMGLGILFLGTCFMIPELLSRRLLDNETAAERVLQVLIDAQDKFLRLRKVAHQTPGFAWNLETLHGQLDEKGNPLISKELASGISRGYRFVQMETYNASGGSDPRYGYAYCAVPVEYGVTGRLKWMTRHTGEDWFQDDGTNVPELRWIWGDDKGLGDAGWKRIGW